MVSPILFAGGEDINFTGTNGGVIGTAPSGFNTWGPDTGGKFRSGYARQAIACAAVFGGTVTSRLKSMAWTTASSNFWFSARLGSNTGNTGTSQVIMTFDDVNGISRIRFRANGATFGSAGFIIEKINAVGSATTLVTAAVGMYTQNPTAPDKIDIFINYAVSGQITSYLNGVQTATFSGDLTTDGNTTLQFFEIGSTSNNTGGGGGGNTDWSEMIVSTRDTRAMSLVTQVATANGNTHNFDSGTAANAASAAMATGQASPQVASSAGLIQEYQVTPSIPTGTFSVISVVQTVQATTGSTGPTKLDLMVRTSLTDFTSTDFSAGPGWATFVYYWDTNPSTTNPWQTSELVGSSTSFNLGVKSIA